MPLQLSIPETSTAEPANGKPYTLYHVQIQAPLRNTTLKKRYSDFEALHKSLISQAGSAPPAPLPQKSWFARTVNNAALTEQRRKELERYLKAIEESDEKKWRHSVAYRSFLELGVIGTETRGGESRTGGRIAGALPGKEAITDTGLWLDAHRDLKTQLHDARLALTKREQAATAAAQHEAGAAAKRSLVLAGTLITSLDEGLKILGGDKDAGANGSSERLGQGELRRRRDLLSNARKERDGLEGVLNSIVVKSPAIDREQSVEASHAEKDGLFHSSARAQPSGRRVLGGPAKETERTRELDNEGVLQLQQKIMAEQDVDVQTLGRAVERMKNMGIQINDELQYQNALLDQLDEGVDRTGRKIDVAKNRIKKIH